jgi:hypothetical protein
MATVTERAAPHSSIIVRFVRTNGCVDGVLASFRKVRRAATLGAWLRASTPATARGLSRQSPEMVATRTSVRACGPCSGSREVRSAAVWVRRCGASSKMLSADRTPEPSGRLKRRLSQKDSCPWSARTSRRPVVGRHDLTPRRDISTPRRLSPVGLSSSSAFTRSTRYVNEPFTGWFVVIAGASVSPGSASIHRESPTTT